MTTITTRAGKGSPLLNSEVDANFTGLNDDKVETSGDSMTGNLSFGDNNKVILGSGSDLQLYHDANNSFIKDSGTGSLYVQADAGVYITNASGSENKAIFTSDGAVNLYHDNALRFVTTSSGIDVTGVITTDGMTTSADVNFGDDDKAVFGAGSDLEIYHESSTGRSFIKETGADEFRILGSNIRIKNGGDSKTYMQMTDGGSVAIRHNDATKLETTSTGIDVTGNATFGDNGKAIFGADSDMSLFHNGNNGFLDNDTGTLFIQTDALSVKNAAGTESVMLGAADGAVTLYHNNSAKLATTSTGIDVTGIIKASGNGKLQISDDTEGSTFEFNVGGSGALEIYDGSTERLRISSGGDISFYEDTGTTAKFLWSASDEKLTIDGNGTTVTNLSTAVSQSVLELNGNSTEGSDALYFGAMNANGDYYLQVSNSNGTATNYDLLLNPYGGNVGIGTSSSAYKLQVNGSGTVARFTDGTSHMDFYAGSNLNEIATASPLLLSVGGSERMRIDSSGEFTLGNSSGGSALQLDVSATGTDGVDIKSSYYSGGYGPMKLHVGGSERMRITSAGDVEVKGGNELRVYRTDNATYGSMEYLTGAGGLKLRDVNGDGMTFAGPSSDYMRILTGGNVGIGTSPSNKLDVKGTVGFEATNSTNKWLAYTYTDNSLRLNYNGAGADEVVIDSGGNVILTKPNGAYLQFKDASAVRGAINVETSDGLVFTTGASFTERMRILSNGRVSIGSSPSSSSELLNLTATSGNGAGIESAGNGNTLGSTSAFYGQGSGSDAYVWNRANNPILFGTNNTECARFGNTGDLEIGSQRVNQGAGRYVDIYNAGTDSTTFAILRLIRQQAASTSLTTSEFYARKNGETTLWNFETSSSAYLRAGIGTTEGWRIHSSGNVLLGKSSPAFGTAGVELNNAGVAGKAWITRSGGEPLALNRLSNDGSILEFYKDGSDVGFIGCRSSGGNLYIDTNNSGIDFGGSGYLPMYNGSLVDNVIDIGASSYRYDDIHATNGTIQTSDRNEKQDIEELTEAEQRVAVACKGLLRKYRWKSAVEKKGDDARIHFGIIAQDLQTAFEAEGLDAGRYGMFINSTWTDEETGKERSRMGVRYSELLAFIISAI